jgi:ribonuclease P protein component
VGFAVSRRVGGAVERNRTRRRIREAYRRTQDGLQGSIEVMFVARPAALTRPFPRLLEEMAQTLDALSRGAARQRPPAGCDR